MSDSPVPRWRTSTYALDGPGYHGAVWDSLDGWTAWIVYHDDLEGGETIGCYLTSWDAKRAVENYVWNQDYHVVFHA